MRLLSRQLLLLSLMMFVWAACFAQPDFGKVNYGYKPGRIVKKTGDTLNCLVEVEISYDDASRIRYKMIEADDPVSIKVKDIKSMKVLERYFEVVPAGKKERLMTVVTEGKMSLYRYSEMGEQHISRGSTDTKVSINYFIQYVIKKDDNYIKIERKKFKEGIKEVFSDCKSVIDKINSDSVKYEDLEKIVSEYNKCEG